MNNSWRKIIGTSTVRVYSLLMGLASLALTSRFLGPEGRGVIAGVIAWVTLFAKLGSLSMGQVVVHHAATQRDKSWLGPVSAALVLLTIILSILIWLLTATIGYFKGDIFGRLPVWALCLGFLSLPFYIWESYGVYLLTSSGLLTFYNRVQIFTSSIGFVLIVIALVIFEWGVGGVLLATLMTSALIAGVGISKIWRSAKKTISIKATVVHTLIRNGLKLHLNAVGGVSLTVVNTLMINYYSNPVEVGWYQLASQLIATVMILPQAVSRVLNERTGESGPDQMWPEQKHILVQLIGLMLVVIILGYFLSPWIVVLIAGKQFLPSVEVFRILLVSVVGLSLSHGMANQWLGRGLFLQTALLTLFFGCVNILLNAIFIPRYGMVGAAWSTAAVYSVAILTNLGMIFYVQSRWRGQHSLSQRGVM